MNPKAHKKAGFTLIELLVVIAIIALLVSISLPVLRLVRQQATGIICLSNQKSLVIGWLMYADENDGTLVGGKCWYGNNYNWAEPPQDKNGYPVLTGITIEDSLRGLKAGLLFPYMKTMEIYRCPGDRRKMDQMFLSYLVAGGMNGQDINIRIRKLSSIKMPSEKYVFVEESDPREFNGGSWLISNPTDLDDWRWLNPLAIWHNKKSTLSFADGHAEMRTWVDKRTIEMSENQQWAAWTPNNPDLIYMKRGYAHKK